jgi:hypothetical protein
MPVSYYELNGQAPAHYMTLRSGVADSTIFQKQSMNSREILVSITSIQDKQQKIM